MKKLWECIHRGEKVATKTCNTCGGRGKQVDVFRCELHKYCSLTMIRAGSEIKFCKLCQDLKNPDGGTLDE